MSNQMTNFQLRLTFQNRGKIYQPDLVEGVQWETQRSGAPGKLTCEILTDHVIDPGDIVQFYDDAADSKNPIFLGTVFTTSHNSNAHRVKVTAYDQIRYLKNPGTYVYQGWSPDKLVKQIAADYALKTGAIDSCPYKNTEVVVAENKTLLDIIGDALDDQMRSTGKMYILFDWVGKLCLLSSENKWFNPPILLDATSMQDFDMESSIDSNTYNSIRLLYKDNDSGKTAVFSADDKTSQQKIGILMYTEIIDDQKDANNKAKGLLKLYDIVSRSVTLKGVPGDKRVYAGCKLWVKMSMGDNIQDGYLMVNKCVHKWDNFAHTMDLTMEGGVFSA